MNDYLIKALENITDEHAVLARRGYWQHRRDSNLEPIEQWEEDLKEELYEEEVEEDEDEDDERSEEVEVGGKQRKVAPENLQEGLKNKVLKNRSPTEREKAIKLLPDDFIEEQVRNKKQMKRVREYGLRLLEHNTALVDDMASNADYDVLKRQAMGFTKNKDILLQDFKNGNSNALWKLDEDTVIKNLPSNTKDLPISNYSSSFNDFVNKIKKPKNANFLVKKLTKDGHEINNLELIQKVEDLKTLKDIFPKITDENSQAYIILKHKDDKTFVRKALNNKENSYEINNLVLNILNDQKTFKDHVTKSNEWGSPDYALTKIEDEEFIKKYLIKTAEDSTPPNKVLEKIKDEKFLKQYYQKSKNDAALTNITDKEFIRETFDKTQDLRVIKHIKDEAFLKDYYQEYLPEKGARKSERDTLANHRESVLPGISDQEFIQKVAKKDPHYEVRMKALKYITDTEALTKILTKEKSKTALLQMLDNVTDQDALMEIIKKKQSDTDGDIRSIAYDRLVPDSTLKMLKDGFNPPAGKVKEVDDKTIRDLLLEKESIAEEYYQNYSKDNDFTLDLLEAHPRLAENLVNNISDEKSLKKLLMNNDDALVAFQSYGKVTDPELLEYLLMNKTSIYSYYGGGGTDLLTQLNPDDAFIQNLVQNAASENVKKEALTFIKDTDLLFEIMLENKSYALGYDIFRQIWKDIKEDKAKVEKMAKQIKNDKIIRGIIPAIKKDDKLLKEASKNTDDDELKLRIISLMKDKKYILEIIPTVNTYRLKGVDGKLIYESLLTNKDLKYRTANELIRHLKHRDYEFTFLDLYKNAVSDNVRGLAVLKAHDDDDPIPENLIEDDLLVRVSKNDDVYGSDKVTLMTSMKDKDKVIEIIPSLDSRYFDDIKDQDLISRALMENPTVNYKQAENLINYLVNEDKGVAPIELYEKAASEDVKHHGIIKLTPDEVEKGMVDDFMAGLRKTDRPYEVSKELIKKVYDMADDDQQDSLQGFLDMKHLLPRHKEAIEKPYKSPKKSEHSKPFVRFQHSVEKNPINQVFRLLVHLARY